MLQKRRRRKIWYLVFKNREFTFGNSVFNRFFASKSPKISGLRPKSSVITPLFQIWEKQGGGVITEGYGLIAHASQVGGVPSSTKCVQNYFTASKLLFLMLERAQIKFSKKLQMYTFHIKKTRSWLVSSFLRSIHLLFSFSLKTEMITPKSAGTIPRPCPDRLKIWSKNRCSAFKNDLVDLKPSPFDQKCYFW